ncbi:MAG: nucleotide-binding protein [Thermoplasmata archaeon]|nr:MAG: nucleotide-binding protein [Thermoplasmata archaeon]
MPLPMLTSHEDVDQIVYFLRNHPDGTTVTEAVTVLPRQLLEPQKINSYVHWNIIVMDGDKIKLGPIGEKLSKISPEHHYLVYGEIIRQLKPYASAIQWMFQKDFNEITNIEVSSHWHSHYKEDLGTSDENQMKSMGTCFFQICQAAGLGQLSKGRSSQIIHFTINKKYLGKFFTEMADALEAESARSAAAGVEPVAVIPEAPPSSISARPADDLEPIRPLHQRRIFISHSKNNKIVEQLVTMLEVEKFGCEVIDQDISAGSPLPDNLLSSMRKCNASIIFVTTNESEKRADGKYGIKPGVLLEIGAAYVLHNKNVMLVWDSRIEPPAGLKDMEHFKFSGNELDWNAGVDLMNAVKKLIG